MRVLLDTNILARAAGGPPGLAHRLFLEVTRHEHALLLSSFLVVELGRVLRYDRVRRLHGLSDDEIDSFLSDLVLVAEMVQSSEPVPAVVPDDPEDDPSFTLQQSDAPTSYAHTTGTCFNRTSSPIVNSVESRSVTIWTYSAFSNREVAALLRAIRRQ